MYTIKHGNRTLFDPSIEGHYIEAPILYLEANKLASLEFTIYPDNPEFTQIGVGTSVLSVYKDGVLMLRLRPMYKKMTFAGGVTYKCEEQAAILNDVLHRPDYFDGTIQAYMQHMIDAYNDLVDSTLSVNLGNVLFNATTEDTFINDDYEGFWEALVDNLVDVYGGYLLPRYTTSGIYIDYVTDSDLPTGTQTIRFGENMSDLFIETETSETYTVLIPLGADVDVEDPEDGQAKQRPMTIASVNDGKDYLENAAGIAVYGRREKTQQWQSIDSASELKTKGQEYLTEHAAELKKTITLSAVDLHYLSIHTDAITWMTSIPIVSEPHNIDTQYTATKLDLNLGNPEPIQLQLGEPSEVFTDTAPESSVSSRRSGSSGGGRAASSSDVEHWEMIVRKDTDILWDSGVKEIQESGVILDAESGVSLYNLKDIIVGNNQVIGLKGYIDINAEAITQEVTRATGSETSLSGRIDVEAGRITQIVTAVGSSGQVTAASIVLAINGSSSSVTIDASKVYINANTSVQSILTGASAATSLSTGSFFQSSGGTLQLKGRTANWSSITYVTGVSVTLPSTSLSNPYYFVYGSASDPQGAVQGRLVTGHSAGSVSVNTDTKYFLVQEAE